MGTQFKLWASLFGVPVGDGSPILTAISGNIVMGEVNQFEPHTIVCPLADEAVIRAMVPFTLLEIEQDGVGTVGFGYMMNPQVQILGTDAATVTFELPQRITQDLTWRRTRSWAATGQIKDIVPQLGALATGWSATFTGDPNDPTGANGDFPMSITIPNLTVLNGALQLIQTFSQYMRVSRDALGAPITAFEVGQFGAPATVYFQDPKGADLDEVRYNNLIKIPAQLTFSPADVRNLMNVAVPKGGGNDAASLVSLERPWRMINDPRYPNYGRFGTDAESIARTGLPSMFPEYDSNYPISDPENPPTGQFQWGFLDNLGNVLPGPYGVVIGTRRADGTVPLFAFDVHGIYRPEVVVALQQGNVTTRGISRDGSNDYICFDAASYNLYGFKEGSFTDSTLTYTDQAPADQELTARALYNSIKAQFLRYGHPHHVVTAVVNGEVGRPVREGDFVAFDFQRQGSDEETGAAIIEANIVENFRVMKVDRAFGPSGVWDTYLLSNVGRFDNDDAQQGANAENQIIAIQRREGTSFTPMFFGPYASNVDAATPMRIPVRIPDQLYAWGQCSLRIDFEPFELPSTTAYSDPNLTFNIEIGGEDIELDTPNDINLGGTFNTDGSGAVGTTDGFSTDLYVHVYGISGSTGATTGTGFYPESAANAAFGRAGNAMDIPVYRNKTAGNQGLDTATTKSGFTAPVNKLVKKAGATIARLKANSVIAKLPTHVHLLDQKVAKGTVPIGCYVSIDGLALSSGLLLTSGSRNNDGRFTSTAEINDIGQFINKPGQTLTFEFDSPADPIRNPTGAGRFLITGTWFGQFGGLAGIVTLG